MQEQHIEPKCRNNIVEESFEEVIVAVYSGAASQQQGPQRSRSVELECDKPKARGRDESCVEMKFTYRYIQFDVSRFGLPVSHSGAKVIQPKKR
jgi:hypothetical protein